MSEMARSDSAPENSPAPNPLTYAELAREVVTQLAPDELDLLDDVIRAWQDGDLDGRGPALGEALGSGLDPQLTSEIILPVLTGAVSTVLAEAMTGSWSRVRQRVRDRFKRRRPRDLTIPQSLSTGQLDQVRAAVLESATRLGIGRRRTQTLADAVWGALARHQQAGEDAGRAPHR